MPRLTLCLIARDEEWMLPECLASVKGVVDEIVVVDTGSVDRTAAIAREAGAKLVSHVWNDDFAAARNAALPAATGDWILLLDADERLGPGAAGALRKAMRDAHTDCFLLPLHNATRLDASFAEVVSGAARRGEPGWLPRLLRRTPDLLWEGVIHESVGGWITRGRRKTGRAPAPIVHYGAVPEVRAALSKDARNLRLLERRCRIEPDSPVARTYLARELIRGGDHPRADRELEIGWEALRAAVARGEGPSRVQLVSVRAHRQLERGEPDAVLAMMAEVAGWGEVLHPNLPLLTGIAWARKAAAGEPVWERAEAAFRAALAAPKSGHAEEVLPGASGWQSQGRLGAALLATGRPDAARAALEAAVAENPDDVDNALALAEAHVARDPRRALALAERHLARGTADAWLVAADACEAMGAHTERVTFLERALALPLSSPHRVARRAAVRALAPHWPLLLGFRPAPSPEVDPAALVLRGNRAAESGDAATAFGAWLAAVRIAPLHVPAWAALVTALHAVGHADAAFDLAAGARTVVPGDPDLLALSAELALLTDHPDVACRLARALEALRPEDPVVAAVLGETGVCRAPTGDGAPAVSVVLWGPAEAATVRTTLDLLALDPDVSVEVLRVGAELPAEVGPRPFPRVAVAGGLAEAVACARGATLVFLAADLVPPRGFVAAHLAALAGGGVVSGAVGVLPEHRETAIGTLFHRTDLLSAAPGGPGDTPDLRHLSVEADTLRAVGGLPAGDPLDVGEQLAARLAGAGVPHRRVAPLRVGHTRVPSWQGWLADVEARAAAKARLAPDPVDPATALVRRAQVEASLDAADRLSLSVLTALSRGVPLGREDLGRLAPAAARVAAHHAERGAVAGASRWPTPLHTHRRPPRGRTSVVIPNLNGFPHVEGCLGTLRATTDTPTQIVVVDNGSTDGSLEWLRRQPDVTLLELGRNLGAPAARNRGLAVADGDRILFCDNDVLFTPGWLPILEGHLDAWPDVGMVGPVSDYVVDAQKVGRPPREGESLEAYAAAVHTENRGRHSYTSQLILFFILARRELVERIGGIDEVFGRWGFEDNDWSLRAGLAGYQLRIARDCFIRHLGSRTSKSANIDYSRLLLENWGVFKRKWDLDPALPYGARLDLNPVLARGFDPARHFVPFR